MSLERDYCATSILNFGRVVSPAVTFFVSYLTTMLSIKLHTISKIHTCRMYMRGPWRRPFCNRRSHQIAFAASHMYVSLWGDTLCKTPCSRLMPSRMTTISAALLTTNILTPRQVRQIFSSDFMICHRPGVECPAEEHCATMIL